MGVVRCGVRRLRRRAAPRAEPSRARGHSGAQLEDFAHARRPAGCLLGPLWGPRVVAAEERVDHLLHLAQDRVRRVVVAQPLVDCMAMQARRRQGATGAGRDLQLLCLGGAQPKHVDEQIGPWRAVDLEHGRAYIVERRWDGRMLKEQPRDEEGCVVGHAADARLGKVDEPKLVLLVEEHIGQVEIAVNLHLQRRPARCPRHVAQPLKQREQLVARRLSRHALRKLELVHKAVSVPSRVLLLEPRCVACGVAQRRRERRCPVVGMHDYRRSTRRQLGAPAPKVLAGWRAAH